MLIMWNVISQSALQGVLLETMGGLRNPFFYSYAVDRELVALVKFCQAPANFHGEKIAANLHRVTGVPLRMLSSPSKFVSLYQHSL